MGQAYLQCLKENHQKSDQTGKGLFFFLEGRQKFCGLEDLNPGL